MRLHEFKIYRDYEDNTGRPRSRYLGTKVLCSDCSQLPEYIGAEYQKPVIDGKCEHCGAETCWFLSVGEATK